MSEEKLINNSIKKLYRSRTDKILFGVCGGAAKYFDIDSAIIRIFFVLFAFLDGAGVLLYLIFTIFIPLEPGISKENGEEEIKEIISDVKNKNFSHRRKYFGLIIIIIGLFIILKQYFPMYFFFWFNWRNLWPYLIILFGFYLIFKDNKIK